MQVRIRPASSRDDGSIAPLLVESFLRTYARKMPEVRLSERRLRELRDVAAQRQSSHVIVAELAGRVVGTAALIRPDVPDSHAWTANTAEIRRMAVHPDMHGHGLSTALLDELHRTAAAWGVSHVCLHVRRGAHGIGRLYKKHGYRRDSRGDLDLLPEVFLEAYLRAV